MQASCRVFQIRDEYVSICECHGFVIACAWGICAPWTLILWRHADAQGRRRHGHPQTCRDPLTPRVANKRPRRRSGSTRVWLKPARILMVSRHFAPAKQPMPQGRKVTIIPELAPGGLAAHVLIAADWPEARRRPVLVVGHQLALGRASKSAAVWPGTRPLLAPGRHPLDYRKPVPADDTMARRLLADATMRRCAQTRMEKRHQAGAGMSTEGKPRRASVRGAISGRGGSPTHTDHIRSNGGMAYCTPLATVCGSAMRGRCCTMTKASCALKRRIEPAIPSA